MNNMQVTAVVLYLWTAPLVVVNTETAAVPIVMLWRLRESNASFLNNQPDTPVIPILFCYKTLHVSHIFSAHHQEFSAVHSALVSFMQVLMTASK